MSGFIDSDPEILGGKPVIKGTRIPVDLIFELIGCNIPINEILEDYPSLNKEILKKLIKLGLSAQKNLSRSDLKNYINTEINSIWYFY